jgi:hypothetical protein
MNKDLPLSFFMLRKIIAHKAWDIWTASKDPSAVPPRFYDIADMAIKEVHDNVDKMITDVIREKLENLI